MAEDTRIVAVAQHACSPESEDNLARSSALVRQAADQGAQLVLLQELHRYQYFCQVESPAHFDLAETVPGPTTAALGRLAAECDVVIVGSLFEQRGRGVYHNTAVVLDRDGRLAGCYRKQHIPDDPGYYEKYYFTPGDAAARPIETAIGRLGVLVCWDQWFPEAARLQALAGADMLLYPTAIGWDPGDAGDEQARQLEAWMTVQRGHAVANCLPVLVANRIGHETGAAGDTAGIEFWGNSFICGPQGDILSHAGSTDTALLVTRIDLARTVELRRIWPFFRDRRIDAYGDLLERVIDD